MAKEQEVKGCCRTCRDRCRYPIHCHLGEMDNPCQSCWANMFCQIYIKYERDENAGKKA